MGEKSALDVAHRRFSMTRNISVVNRTKFHNEHELTTVSLVQCHGGYIRQEQLNLGGKIEASTPASK